MNQQCIVKWFFAGSVLVILSLLLCGCDKEETARLVFSHNLHVKENGMACSDCHGKAAEGHFARPGHDVCKECHEDLIVTEAIDEKTCGVCHDVKYVQKASKTQPQAAPVTQTSEVFTHTDVLSNRCSNCHGALMEEKLREVPKMTRSDKIRTRGKAHISGMDCAACHVDMNARTPPANHRKNWTRRHGVLGAQEDRVCGVCHRDESCRECHQITMPASHNNLWRLKTHGLQATLDRSRCKVCHEQDSCNTCHFETRPRSHNAAWRQNHCYQCHPNSAAGTGCSLCHPNALDTHPNPHAAGWLNQHCDSCHNDSSQCQACHGWSDLDSHPNPHSAGWLEKHCRNCHPNDSSSDCKTCHGWSGMDSHPNPHGAAWRAKHCGSCHSDRDCKICHVGGVDAHPNPHAAGWRDKHCAGCHSDSSKCQVCHKGGLASHPDPHSVGWRESHCNSCHPGTDNCGICHEGGNSVLVHESFWPDVHNRFGDQATCSDCHM